MEREEEGVSEKEEEKGKPESLLSPQARQILTEVINAKVERALEEGNYALASELQRAKKLVERGCWSIRNDNPYLYFMAQCLLGKGGTLKDTQEAMKKCGEEWKKLPENEKAKYRAQAKGLAVYDYL